MPEKEPVKYENFYYLGVDYEDVENLYHMSMRNPSLEVYGLSGESLSVMCLDDLALLNPEKYQDEFFERAIGIYDEDSELTHFNIITSSLFKRLDVIFGRDDSSEFLSATPTELIQDAYFKTFDRYVVDGGFEKLKVTLFKNDINDIDWFKTAKYYNDLIFAGQLLLKRGFNYEDLNYLDAIYTYHAFLHIAAENAEDHKYHEDAYLLLKNQYKNGIDSGWLESVTGKDADICFDNLEQRFEAMIGRVTPSVSMDIVAGFLQKDPEDKKYRKIAKQYIRCFRPFPSTTRKEFDSLSDLGKKAFFELGGRDPVNEMMGMVSLMASNNSSIYSYRK